MKLKKLFRSLSKPEMSLDEENRTIEFSFSSEEPVERSFGYEILSHKKEHANLSRLNDGANLLFNHNWDIIIGVVEKAWIGDDNRGYCVVRFSKNAKGEEVYQDVKDGIIRNVSFGYIPEAFKITKENKNGKHEYTSEDWMALEVSVTSVPADNSIGIGRNLIGTRSDLDEEYTVNVDRSLLDEQTVKEEKEEEKGIIEMSEKEIVEPKIDTAAIAATARDTERSRIAEINAMGERFGQKELSRQLVESGKDINEARKAFMEKLEVKQTPVSQTETDIGLSEKEKKEFSFMRAINALSNPNDRKFQQAAGFEYEVSEAAAKASGKTSRGIYIPNEVLRFSAQRDLVVGTASAGGNLVGTDFKAASFIELLRNKMVLANAGMTVLSGLKGNVAIPKQTGGATAYFVAENAAPTEGALTVGQVTMSPKTLAAYIDMSRKLQLQSDPSIEQLVRNDLVSVLGLKIDYSGLYGLGSSNEPTGLKATSGINVSDFSAGSPTYAEIVNMETLISSDNADAANMAYLVNSAGRGVLKGVEKASSTGQFVWEPGNTVNGYKALVSNQVATPVSAEHDYWFGNFADLLLGLWGGLDLMADPYTGSKEGTVRITAFQELDFAVRHAESFCYGNKTAP